MKWLLYMVMKSVDSNKMDHDLPKRFNDFTGSFKRKNRESNFLGNIVSTNLR